MIPLHTPGPWEYARTDQFDQSIDIFESKTARTLARTINTLPINEAEANARLIAAAPDLFLALSKMVSRGHLLTADELLEARTAIAKAKGTV